MIVDLILEPDIDATFNGDICCPSALEVLLSNHIGSIHIGVSGDRYGTVDLPRICVSHCLRLSLIELHLEFFCETETSKIWDSYSGSDAFAK